ncbi:hypothetical protein AB0J43_60435 [Nonomuraea fuscirosea]
MNGPLDACGPTRESITLLAGLGVEGDAHMGVTVKHRSRVAQDPTQPNLRQVLIHEELFAEVRPAGNLVRRAGVMSVVKAGGVVRPGDTIEVRLPAGPHRPLDRV